MIKQFDNFLTKGYAVFLDPNLIDLTVFKVTNVEIEKDLPEITDLIEKQLLCQFVDYVSSHYVNTVYNNFQVMCANVWDGVDAGSMTWHNDNVEGFDFNVLYYYDSTSEDTGGEIEFKHPSGEDKIYPQAGNLIFINQASQFQHRANRSSTSRRVASIEYKIL
jgi:hypothetical protein